jgi:hypothetical protein
LGNFPQAYSHLALIDTALNFKSWVDNEKLKIDFVILNPI